MKLGAKIWETSRNIKIEITSACVYQELLSYIVTNLQLIPEQYIRWLLFSHHLANDNKFSIKLAQYHIRFSREKK
jgi:hypothetical protein